MEFVGDFEMQDGSNIIDMSEHFTARIRASKQGQITAKLDDIPSERCELIAEWAFKNYGFGADVIRKAIGYGWDRKNVDGIVRFSKMLNSARPGDATYVDGKFHVDFDDNGMPVSAVATRVSPDYDKVEAYGRAADFSLIAGAEDAASIGAINVPKIEVTELHYRYAEWALENMNGVQRSLTPWRVHEGVDYINFAREIKLGGQGETHRATMRFNESGEPAFMVIQAQGPLGQVPRLMAVKTDYPSMAEFSASKEIAASV